MSVMHHDGEVMNDEEVDALVYLVRMHRCVCKKCVQGYAYEKEVGYFPEADNCKGVVPIY